MDEQPPRPRPPVAVVVVHAPSDKSLKKFTLYDHPNDSTDSASSSTGPGTSKHARDSERRRHALLELVDSEQAYVADLHTLLDVYLARLPALLPGLDAALVARNAAELLAFHTAFARDLAVAGSCDADRVDGAVQAVAQAFLDAASGFSIYDAFCHGHLAASEALRRFESRSEYSVFERTCAALASPATPPHLQHAATAPPERTPSSSRLSILAASLAHPGRPRRHSLGASASSDAVFARGHSHSASGSSSASTPPPAPVPPPPALHFADLLIKPVQRICRYPLLLAQLVPASPRPGDAVLHAAIQAMRGAAAAADDATQRADAAYRSQLIRTRIGLSTTAPIFAHKEVLPAAFLDSLGVVRFAGSLDVIHQHHAPPEPKTRHLGIFVYDGGYVVMVKVLRNKVYEPKHWFALTPACAVEELDTDFAFRISTANGHRFDCFTTSEREKNLYLSALEEARAASPQWTAGDELRYSSVHSAVSPLTPCAGPSSAMASPEPTTTPLPDDTPVTPSAPKRTRTMGSLNKRHSLPLSMAVTVSGHERADRGLDDVMSSAYAQARNQARLSTVGLSMSERRLSTMTVGGLTMTRAASDRGVVRKRPSSNWLAPQLDSLFSAAPTPPAEEVEPDGYAWEVIDPEGDARNSPSHKRRFFARSEAAVLPSPTRSLFSSRSTASASTGAGSSAQRWWASLRRRVKSSPGLPLLGSFSSRDVSRLRADEHEAAPSSIEGEDPHLLLPPKEKGGKGGLLQRANTLTLPILTRRQRPKMPSPSPSVSSSSAGTPGTDEALPLPTPVAPATLGRRRPRPPPPSSKRYFDHTLPPPKPLARGRSLLGSLRGMTPLRAES